MGLYLCRWENGDFSVIQANNKDHALKLLMRGSQRGRITPDIRSEISVAHFRLKDNGMIELEEFGEEFGEHIRERVHPVLGGLGISPCDASPTEKVKIKAAVQQEREWLKARPAPDPDTELGKQIKSQLDLPTAVVNRHVRGVAKEVLRDAKPKGKPN